MAFLKWYKRNCKACGEIIILGENKESILINSSKYHFSYPSVINYSNKTFVLPEMSSQNSQLCYELKENKIFKSHQIRGFENIKLIDLKKYLNSNKVKFGNYEYITPKIDNTKARKVYANLKLSTYQNIKKYLKEIHVINSHKN